MNPLIVNKDSYVTLEEANAYIEDNYFEDSPEYKAWFGETVTDKTRTVALRSSAMALNNLRYKGKKAVAGQKLAFPRVYSLMPGIAYLPFEGQFRDTSLIQSVGGDNGLECAKQAQIVNAVASLTVNRELLNDVTERSVSGIRSRKVSSISETYDGNTERSSNLLIGIYNQDKVFYILNAWLTESIFTL